MSEQQLRDGWQWVELRQVCEQDRIIVQPESSESLRRPYLSLEHVESQTGRLLREPHEIVEDEGRSTTFAFDSRHVLYGKLRPYLNKVALPDFEGRCTTEMIPLLPHDVERNFLAWLLRRNETVGVAMQNKTGSRMPRADMDDLMKMRIPIPYSSHEQQRIAARIEAHMAEIATARAAAEAELAAAEELNSTYLREVFESEEAQGWDIVPLGEVGDIVSGVTLGRRLPETVQTIIVPYLRVANVKDGYLDLEDVFEVAILPHEFDKWCLQYGDILLTEGGDPDKLGRGTFWEEQIEGCIHQNHIFRVRFDLECFLPAFVAAQLGSSYGKAYFLSHAKQTTGIATINQQVLKKFPLMMPHVSVQGRVVNAINERFAEYAMVYAAVKEQLTALEHIPTTILEQAFNGEL